MLIERTDASLHQIRSKHCASLALIHLEIHWMVDWLRVEKVFLTMGVSFLQSSEQTNAKLNITVFVH